MKSANEAVPVLECQGIERRFGGLVAVSAVSLQIPRGSISSLIGPNGAGKTTFFNCVTGFYTPEEGDLIFNGQSVYGLRPDQIAQRGISRTEPSSASGRGAPR